MSLTPGTRLGPYEVIEAIGAGGMGQVFRARDTKLNRDVAIKTLPPDVAGDSERLLRFEREAQTLAALNHPNIAQIFGVLDGPAALVMELVAGDDLSLKIARGRLEPAEAQTIATQIANALEAAHAQGIVHRDLKPANVKVRADGTVKVLDFGLAKITRQSDAGDADVARLADSPTILSPARLRQGYGEAATQVGIILGTAAYMAPEQAKGQPADTRADIWAFGVVLFEMLAGKSAFGAAGVTETIARVIEREPEWSALPATTPAHLRELLARCLVKDPRRRLRDIGDARIVLESPPAATVALATSTAQTGTARRDGARNWLAIGAWVLVVTAALFGYQWVRGGSPSSTSSSAVRQLRLPLTIANVPKGSDFNAVISPDGLKIATLDSTGVGVRILADGRTTALVKDDDIRQVFWSPDSRWIGYATISTIAKVSLEGGTPIQIASLRGIPGPFNVFSGNVAWFPEDRFVFATGFSGLMEVRGTSAPVEITPVDSPSADFHGACPLPDGSVLTSVHDVNVIERFEVVDGKNRVVVYREPGARLGTPVYSATGHILFVRGDGLWAVVFDAASRQTTGKPFLVAEGQALASVSADGEILVATPHVPASQGKVALIRRDGSVERLFAPDVFGRTRFPEFSSDGRSLAIALPDAPGVMSTSTMFVLSDDGRSATQVTNGIDVAAGRWFPDRKRMLIETGSPLCMSGDCYAIGWKALEQDRVQTIVNGTSGDISPDGKTLAFSGRVAGAEWDLFAMNADGTGPHALFQGGPGWQIGARFSPDGKYLAYVSTESGRPEVWVAAFPSGGKWRVSTDAGYWPRWLHDGSRLFYARGTSVVDVPFIAGAPPSFGAPMEVFPSGTLMQMPILRLPYAFDVDRTGQRFVLVKDQGATATLTVQVMQRWVAGAVISNR